MIKKLIKTLSSSLEVLNDFYKKYMAEVGSVLWEAGLTYGFTDFITSTNVNVKHSQAYEVDRFAITVWSNMQASGGFMLNGAVDLTDTSKLILCYDISLTNSFALGDFGIAVSKTPNAPTNYEKKALCGNANLSVSKGILELDVSELSGEYYIYIPLNTRNTGGTERFYIRSIKKEYLV